MDDTTRIVKTLAPEDIRRGRYVMVMHEVYNVVMLGCGESPPPRQYPIPCLPDDDETPLKVLDTCLPFVLTRKPTGEHRLLDVRRHKLGVLAEPFGRRTFKRLGEKPRKRRRT